jgi:hypothetical protein
MKRAVGIAAMSLACALAACGGKDETGLLPLDGKPKLGSDPVPPPAQGAVSFTVSPASPAPDGKSCPSPAFTASIPDTSTMPSEALDALNYRHKVIDGEGGAKVGCTVAEQEGWHFSASLQVSGAGLRIEGGLLSAERVGSATITVSDSSNLQTGLSSSEPCAVTAMPSGANKLTVQRGAIWAQFRCATVEAAPSDSCAAEGFFVFENCER